MTDKEKWLNYRNRMSMGLGLEGEETQWIFSRALESIETKDELIKMTIVELAEHLLNGLTNDLIHEETNVYDYLRNYMLNLI